MKKIDFIDLDKKIITMFDEYDRPVVTEKWEYQENGIKIVITHHPHEFKRYKIEFTDGRDRVLLERPFKAEVGEDPKYREFGDLKKSMLSQAIAFVNILRKRFE